jgi:hypothetical protein
MFEPDGVLPEQFAALRGKPLQQEKRLLLAMVEDAVHCFQTYLFAQRLRERRLFQEAEDRLNATDSELNWNPLSVRPRAQRVMVLPSSAHSACT